MKENKQTLKNELNEEEQSKVSGGYRIYHSKGDFKDPDGIYNIYCDFCGKKFEGKGVFEVEGGLHGCVDCYKKLQEIKKMDPNASLKSLRFKGGN